MPVPDTATARLDELFAPWNRSDAPGLAVGVARDGATIYRRGFGMASLESPTPITPQTKLRIGSTTKHFTALLALLLAEEGKLDLDLPIRTWLPELSGPGGEPSLRLLLQHRGGSRCYLDLGLIAHGGVTPPIGWMLDAQARQTGWNFAPGEAVIYNNGGYALVSLAIERAGGSPFEDQLRTRLLAPVGMADTASVPSDLAIVPGMATLHVPDGAGGWRRGIFPTDENRGEGAIVSTVDDMLRWMAHLRRRDMFGSADSWNQLMQRPVLPDGGISKYALGLMVETYRDLPVVHHAGGVVGGTSQMLTFPDDGLDIVILCNGAPGAAPPLLAEKVADILLEDRLGPVAQTVGTSDHPALPGDWWSAETGLVYSIRDDDGTLKLAFCGAPAGVPIRPAGEGRALVSIGSIGDVELDIAAASETDSLAIRFGGHSAAYRKLTPAAADAAAFGRFVAGRYQSGDADCTADIRVEGDGITLAMRDGIGGWSADLTPLSDRVAIVATQLAGLPYSAALTVSDDGFQLQTQRTRHLAFQRIAAG